MDAVVRNEMRKINALLEIFPTVLILGVRQCGKTSLAKMARPNWKYFDLENSKDRTFISKDFDFFFEEYNSHIIIDEAQELPELFKNIRGVIDQKRSIKNRFILTGSSSPDLISLASDSLAGRVGLIELGTLKVNEQENRPLPQFYSIFEEKVSTETIKFLKSLNQEPSKDIIKYFLKGGYPEPVLQKSEKYYHHWMQNYFDSYINRDVRKLFPKLNLERYQRFIQMLSELSGTVLNRAQIGISLDINEVSIRDYLEIADKTFVWRNIPSYEGSKSKSIIKMKKGILRDSGLTHYLSDIITREQLIRSPKVGQNFEAFIIEEIIKGLHNSNCHKWDYFYYRTKHGAEIDLVLTGHFEILPIEIKFSKSANPKSLHSLKRFLEQEKLPLGVLINNDDEIKMLSKNIIQIPSFLL